MYITQKAACCFVSNEKRNVRAFAKLRSAHIRRSTVFVRETVFDDSQSFPAKHF